MTSLPAPRPPEGRASHVRALVLAALLCALACKQDPAAADSSKGASGTSSVSSSGSAKPVADRPGGSGSTTPVELSDALRAPRPEGGEHFGLYLMGKKVGWLYTELARVEGRPERARSISEMSFQASVGGQTSQRHIREERFYEARPGGPLRSFRIEQSGDGGDQLLEGTADERGLTVVRQRPGRPNEVLRLPPTGETIESADAPRVALLRSAPYEGTLLDGLDLEDHSLRSHPLGEERRLVAGVEVSLRKVSTVSSKENVPYQAWVTHHGEVIEIAFGETLRARAEPVEVAKRLDQVELFGLTRVVLPRAIPDPRRVPNRVRFTLASLDDRYFGQGRRQTYRKLPDGRVEVTVAARSPAAPAAGSAVRPLKDPQGGRNLASDLVVELEDRDIQRLARRLAGDEADAWTVAQRMVTWVGENLDKAYGASADRAGDVLRQGKGDCTEHALLAVALLRSAGVPAKRVDGLVYLVNDDGVPALYWHQWVSAWTGGSWVDMDPTFGQVVADATHLALGEESKAEIAPLIGTLTVTRVE